MTVVVKLCHRESVRLDRAQLERMYVQWGPVRADKEVNQALEDLAIGMADVQKSHRQGRLEDLRDQVRVLIGIANRIGMTSLGRVARDVLELSATTDAPAFNATVARLGRISERSLIAVWDIQDMSI